MKGLVTKILAPVLIPIMMTLPNCQEPTPKPKHYEKTIVKYVENDAEKDVERQVILDTADRLIQLQNANGSWDWDVTNATGPTATTYYNMPGVTGKVLIRASNITQDSKYIDAAKKAGDYIVGTAISTTQRQNAFNIIFLHDLYSATGEAKYKNKADAIYNHLRQEENYWTVAPNDFDVDGTTGLSAEELLAAYKNYRGAEVNPDGTVIWDLYNFIEAGKKAGDTAFVNDIANIIKNYLNQSNYTPTTKCYELGLGAGIIALKNAGADYSSYLNKLIAEQYPDGHFENPDFPDEHIQPTAYCSEALNLTGKTSEMKKANTYLVDKHGYNGLSGWLEDGTEYSEVNGEAADALAKAHK